MQPVLIQVTDTFFVGTYGLMIVLGMMLGLGLASMLGKIRGFSSDSFFDLLFIAIICGFVGARILFILTDLPGFVQDPMAYLLSRSGFVFLGGLIFAAAACAFYLYKKKLPILKMGDLVLPCVALAHAFGRFGCHYAGCCFGGDHDGAFSIRVPRIDLPDGTIWPNVFVEHAEMGKVAWDNSQSLPVWPVQLMEAGGLLVIAAALVLIFLNRPRVGLVFGLYLVSYSALRFVLEYLRGDEFRGYIIPNMISTSQGLSILLLGLGVWVILHSRKQPRWELPEEEQQPAASDEKEATTTADKIRRRRRKKNQG
ncbi:MAG: prolipoprotein diacylglyceryl transferase [Candidatus Sumerlaeia bacterium]|nr:prolipoprotein diacylglyceryl transferase [Candidatus Sumerlaeia bacterium]